MWRRKEKKAIFLATLVRFREKRIEVPFAVAAQLPVVLLCPGTHFGTLGRVRTDVKGGEVAEVVVNVRAKDFAVNPLTTSAFNTSQYDRYKPANEVAKILQVSNLTLARITSNLYFSAPLDVREIFFFLLLPLSAVITVAHHSQP